MGVAEPFPLPDDPHDVADFVRALRAVKPDVVMEGGNIARSPAGTEFDSPTTFGVLTTKAPLRDQRLLTVSNATSAATAQAAHLASSVMATYPGLWPETVRALIVHSARWTPAMRQRFDRGSGKRDRDSLRRRYGMGVPDLTRATCSAADSLTIGRLLRKLRSHGEGELGPSIVVGAMRQVIMPRDR